MTRMPVPPFSYDDAVKKVRMAEDAWNTRDPDKVALDLPVNFHPAETGAIWIDTPIGAGGATDIRAPRVIRFRVDQTDNGPGSCTIFSTSPHSCAGVDDLIYNVRVADVPLTAWAIGR